MPIIPAKLHIISAVKKGLPVFSADLSFYARQSFINIRILTVVSSFFIILFIWPASAESAQTIHEDARRQYNSAVERIYERLLQLKGDHPELKFLYKSAVSEGENGFSKIIYAYDFFNKYSGDPHTYRFVLTVKDMDAENDESVRQWKFPLLGFQVVLKVDKEGNFPSPNLNEIIEENLYDVRMLEQEYLPFRLSLATDKEVYEINERIALTVSLHNKITRGFNVASLNANSLYCTIDDMTWGNKGRKNKLDTVLMPGQSLKKLLKIQGIESARDAWVTCTYALGFKGVKPYNRIQVKVRSSH